MTDVVLDLSAVIAVFKFEPGWEKVAPLLQGGIVSAVIYAEIVTWLARRTGPADIANLEAMDMKVVDFDRPRAVAAGLLEPKTRRRGLSLGDRACLALAIELGCPVITADRPWRDVDVGVEIRLIR